MNRDRIGRHEARPAVQQDREQVKRRMVERVGSMWNTCDPWSAATTSYTGKHRGEL